MSAAALVIGVNYTTCAHGMRLRGCHNDAYNMRRFLIDERGVAENDVELLVDAEDTPHATTRSRIIEAIHDLAAASRERKLERVYVHYSGHGTQVVDHEGEEADGKDEAIVPSDCHRAGVIKDDEIGRLLDAFDPDTCVMLVFDCCHSGTMCDLPVKMTSEGVVAAQCSASESLSARECKDRCKVIAISGCKDWQVSMDAFNVRGKRDFSGAMTSSLLHVLRTNPATTPLSDLFDLLRDRLAKKDFVQLPVFTATSADAIREECF